MHPNIIAISGKIGSGKSTVAKILQQHLPEFQIQIFAGRLKQFVADILSVPIEYLDDQDFKKSILGPEWAYFDSVLDWSKEKDQYKKQMTVRDMLIRIGNGMREKVHPDIWTTALLNQFDIELWKDISGYEDSYEISSYGRIRSKDRMIIYGNRKGEYHNRLGKVLKPTKSGEYLTVSLSGNTHQVHTLVALHFCQKVESNLVVNHIDFNKTNNYWKNLEWISQGDNARYTYKMGKACVGEDRRGAKLNNEKVLQIKKLLNEGVGVLQIAKAFEVNPTTISNIKTGKRWSHVGKEIPLIAPIMPPKWIISDMRYQNEKKRVERMNGITIRIERPGITPINHVSETNLDSAIFDFTINNDGSLQDLEYKVKSIANELAK